MCPSRQGDVTGLLLRSLPTVTVGVLDEDLQLIHVEGSWLRRTGQTAEQLLGRCLTDLAGHDLAEQARPALTAALAGTPSVLRVQNPGRTDPEAPVWIELVVQPATSATGRPEVFWTLRDVTGEHRAAVALSEAEQRLQLVDEGAHEYATFALSPAGEVATWNGGCVRLTGWAAADVIGRPFAASYPAEAREAGLPELALRLAAERGSFREETWQLHRTGTRLWCRVSVKALHTAAGQPLGYACIVRDLSDQRRSQAALAAREEMYRAAFDDAPSGMALVERHPGGWWRIREANAALATMTGYPVTELVSGAVTLLAEHRDGRVREVFDHDGHRFEVALVRADGTRRATVVGLSPLTEFGPDATEERYVAQFHDVTARRDAERTSAEALVAERRSGHELRELERLRSDFLATVSHELRTPLSSVLGYVELFEDGDLGELSGTQQAALAGISRNSTRLRDLVGDLLVMSSIQRGSLRAERHPTGLDDVVAAARARIEPEVLARGNRLAVTGDRGVRVEVDAALLERVLLGLLGNAVKFTPAGGSIALVVEAGERAVAVRVIDDGVGIAPGDLPHVFDAFYRSAQSEKLAVAGTGLGLSLVKRVVEIYDGTIDVVSEPGVCTEFVLRLPVLPVAVPGHAAPADRALPVASS